MDLHKIWPHRWINPKAKSFKSPIIGLGVTATKDIFKGEIIGVLGGIIVPKSRIKKYRENMGHAGIQIDDNFFIVPTTRKELEETGIFNHSCNPNLGFKNVVTLIAINNIKKNEELAFDYAFSESYFELFKCNCGSKDCRKIIKSTDWKIKELQRKYGKYFSPYLKDKIDKP